MFHVVFCILLLVIYMLAVADQLPWLRKRELSKMEICPKYDFFNFSESFFADQLNLENEKRFDPLANGSGTKASQTGSDKNKFITGLKFVSININSIRGKKLELLAFINLRLWQFKRQKLTAPYLPQNCFRNLVHIMCTEKIEP